MIKIVKKYKGASATAKVVVKDKQSGEVLHESNEEREMTSPFTVPDGKAVGVAKFSETLTTSHSFQGYHCTIGVDFPFAMTPGDIGAFKKPFEQAQELCDELLAEKLQEAPAILSKLVGLKSRVTK